MRKFTSVACAAVFLWCANISCTTVHAESLAFITHGKETTWAPIGWTQFCIEHPQDCLPSAPARISLTRTNWEILMRVNQSVNAFVKPMSDLEHYGVIDRWTYPNDGYGDCEDYVLLKRRTLIALGFPQGALSITVVRDFSGEGHAVLVVRTTKGDMLFDNLTSAILPWAQTGYRFISQQTAELRWVEIESAVSRLRTAATRR